MLLSKKLFMHHTLIASLLDASGTMYLSVFSLDSWAYERLGLYVTLLHGTGQVQSLLFFFRYSTNIQTQAVYIYISFHFFFSPMPLNLELPQSIPNADTNQNWVFDPNVDQCKLIFLNTFLLCIERNFGSIPGFWSALNGFDRCWSMKEGVQELLFRSYLELEGNICKHLSCCKPLPELKQNDSFHCN